LGRENKYRRKGSQWNLLLPPDSRSSFSGEADVAPQIETQAVEWESSIKTRAPINPETWIPYELANPAEVTIRIYNLKGKLIRTINLGTKNAGAYTNKTKAAHL